MRKELNYINGKVGENIAVEYLKKKKYKINEVNYKNKLGEIDIIASYKKTLIFIEVKRRSTLKYGRPSEAVDKRKQEKIRNIAQLYLIKNKINEVDCRFDVIEVIDNEIHYIENAF